MGFEMEIKKIILKREEMEMDAAQTISNLEDNLTSERKKLNESLLRFREAAKSELKLSYERVMELEKSIFKIDYCVVRNNTEDVFTLDCHNSHKICKSCVKNTNKNRCSGDVLTIGEQRCPMCRKVFCIYDFFNYEPDLCITESPESPDSLNTDIVAASETE